jgi:hypothetical protein
MRVRVVLEFEGTELLVDNLPNNFVRGHLVARILLVDMGVIWICRFKGEKYEFSVMRLGRSKMVDTGRRMAS